MAPTIEHHGGHLRTPANKRRDQVPGGVSVPCLASRTRHECPRHKESVYIESYSGCGPTLYRKCHSHNTPGKKAKAYCIFFVSIYCSVTAAWHLRLTGDYFIVLLNLIEYFLSGTEIIKSHKLYLWLVQNKKNVDNI